MGTCDDRWTFASGRIRVRATAPLAATPSPPRDGATGRSKCGTQEERSSTRSASWFSNYWTSSPDSSSTKLSSAAALSSTLGRVAATLAAALLVALERPFFAAFFFRAFGAATGFAATSFAAAVFSVASFTGAGACFAAAFFRDLPSLASAFADRFAALLYAERASSAAVRASRADLLA